MNNFAPTMEFNGTDVPYINYSIKQIKNRQSAEYDGKSTTDYMEEYGTAVSKLKAKKYRNAKYTITNNLDRYMKAELTEEQYRAIKFRMHELTVLAEFVKMSNADQLDALSPYMPVVDEGEE